MSKGKKPKIAVIQYPGTNCEYETARAVISAGMEAEIFRWNRTSDELEDFDGYIIPGGFSYQDRVRAGVIAAKQMVVRTLLNQAEKGKPIMGICNGAQILVEAGMIPGLNWSEVQMGLAKNIMVGRSGYYCNWVFVSVTNHDSKCIFTTEFETEEVIPIPVAHGEGRFVTIDETLLGKMKKNGQVVLRYCTVEGYFDDQFPINPNGSIFNIAGICNKEGNVFAMMPHPERCNWLRQVPDDLNHSLSRERMEATRKLSKLEGPGPGRKFFLSMRKYLEGR